VVLVGDDVALPPEAGIAGRRGLAGVLLVHKVAGAAAEAGLPLPAVAAEARAVAERLASVGAGFTCARIPGAAPARLLAPGTFELGLGIHNEPGAETLPLCSADELTACIVQRILSSGYVAFPPSAKLVVLINSLGGTPPGELMLVCRAALALLRAAGFHVARVFSGALMTSLDAAGVSITLLRVDDDGVLRRLDAFTDAPAWPRLSSSDAAGLAVVPCPAPPAADVPKLRTPSTPEAAALAAAIRAGAQALVAAESQLSSADSVVGDGDCGATLAAGASAVLEDMGFYDMDDAATTAASLAASVRRSMGGTSGLLYDVFFSAAAAAMAAPSPSDVLAVTDQLRQGLAAGSDAVARCGGASVGMRTMLDALQPAAAAALAGTSAAAVTDAAQAGAEATRGMPALAGRSSYVPAAVLAATPDPGAMAVAIWLRAGLGC
jgi:dihydroxyacetone kinase